MNSLGVIAVIAGLGGSARQAAEDMSTLSALSGRGARERLKVAGGTFDLIDESYNANPLSMSTAIATLGRAVPAPEGGVLPSWVTCWNWADGTRTARRNWRCNPGTRHGPRVCERPHDAAFVGKRC
jgi:hypothetical protein